MIGEDSVLTKANIGTKIISINYPSTSLSWNVETSLSLATDWSRCFQISSQTNSSFDSHSQCVQETSWLDDQSKWSESQTGGPEFWPDTQSTHFYINSVFQLSVTHILINCHVTRVPCFTSIISYPIDIDSLCSPSILKHSLDLIAFAVFRNVISCKKQ